ncbi:MAG TPA: tRNA 2-thiouridine(34) synthase MnmA [Patescibacteria group bacterium]|nr:tRNA 2-thiouridine(34) synthase MnmA [Patescibacteria group bacterium]
MFWRKKSPRLKILVGMSGGVDSSVSAALLMRQGYDVCGGFIKNWSDTKDLWTGECAWQADRRDAIRVAAKLDIPLRTFDFEKEYRSRVLDRMFQEYQQGLTPNPDVLCNEEIKFGLFFEAAIALGFDAVATGHYAQTKIDQREVAHLYKGKDPGKDQSYFLHRLSQSVLTKTIFPIGDLTKKRVRVLAKAWSLPTAEKPDSQGICFIGKLDFHEFLRKRIKERPGEIVTADGKVLGRHDGLDAYTIGQRQGIGVSRDRQAWYVAAKDRELNRLIIVPRRDDPLLFSAEARLSRLHLIAHTKATVPKAVDVAIRYHQKPERAKIAFESDMCSIRFRRPIWALAPGQSAVFYHGNECLGGGEIMEKLEAGVFLAKNEKAE